MSSTPSLTEQYADFKAVTVKGELFFKTCDTLATEIAALRRRVAELEARPTLKYVGVFTGSVSYSAGEFATHGGSLYHCNVNGTTERPGTGGAWTMVAKCGRDGRDAKDAR